MMSLTESGGGSDAEGNMKTFAKRDGDVYRITGQKMWASMANETDVGVLLAKTDRNAGAKGVTAFIVHPKKYPGWKASRSTCLGLSKSMRTNVLFLDDFVVPVEDRLGEEGEGFKIIMRTLQPGRDVGVAAKALGVARALLRGSRALRQRAQLRGQPIGRFQMIQSDIAEMAVAIEASRALVYKAAMLHGQQPAAQPLRRHRQVPRLADGQDVRRQGRADLRRLRLGRGIPVSWLRAYADLFFTGEGSANVQKIMIAEDALGYKIADRHHGKTACATSARTTRPSNAEEAPCPTCSSTRSPTALRPSRSTGRRSSMPSPARCWRNGWPRWRTAAPTRRCASS
jgi:alkylation response protein AidB-like acyl-CoA dehydrogenase